MRSLNGLLNQLQLEFGKSSGRADLFVSTLLAILIPIATSQTSSLLRSLHQVFNLDITRRKFYIFMASPKLCWEELWLIVWKYIPQPLTDGRLLLPIDDSINPKVGKKIFGCGTFFDHAKKSNQSSYVWGQNIVLVGLLKLVHNRWACLPLAFQFYRLKKDITAGFESKIQQAVAMILKIAAVFTKCPLLVITDSWFGNNSLFGPLQKALGARINILSRLRTNAVLYKKPPKKRKKGRGRPKKYGVRIGNAKSLAKKRKKTAQAFEVFLYGRKRTVLAATQIVISKKLQREIKVVWVYNRKHWVALFTTDLTLSVVQIVEYYGARWKIESGLKELKQDLGSSLCQARVENAVTNHLNFCMMAMVLGWINAVFSPKAPIRRHAVSGRRQFAFSDIRHQIACEIQKGIFDGVLKNRVDTTKKLFIKTVLQLAA